MLIGNSSKENPMSTPYLQEQLDALVRRIFSIDDYTFGTTQQGYLVCYRGRLVVPDSAEAYDQLAANLKPMGLTPLFREEDNHQAIYIVNQPPTPKASNPRINLLMFILTLLSVIYVGMTYATGELFPASWQDAEQALLIGGLPFAISLILILGCHEFGHYLMGRYHKVHVTLPYFIPFPFPPFGTMGAFINMKEPARNRRDLMDIAITGPLAGLVVAIVVLFIGLSMSTISTIPTSFPPGYGTQMEGSSLLYLLIKYISFGRLLPAPPVYQMPPLLHWLRYFFTGTPIPLGYTDVMLSPVAMAGWSGILVTSLNLIPVGQLDGGHIFYTLFGKERAKKLLPVVIVLLVLLGFVWNGWFLWALLAFWIGRAYAEPLDQITQLDKKRRILAWSAIVLLILTFTPIPLMLIS
jgi:membrane-associated protease RseP (regulator of RpoE activity)